MLEVHVVNACLDPRLRVWPKLAVLDFLNGLVAPTFLFCAGFAVALSLRRALAAAADGGTAPWQRVLVAALRRTAMLLFVGYALHGYGVLWVGLSDPRVVTELLKADVLQVIGLSLLTLNLLAFAARRASAFALGALLLGALVLFSTPMVRALDGAGWPALLRPYFSARAPAQFSLFPWSAFAFFGAALGARPAASWARKLGVWAVLLIIGGVALYRLAPLLFPPHDPWRSGPGFTLLRLGLVCLLATLFALTQEWRLLGRLDPVLLPFSRHSLAVYTVHQPLVFGGLFGLSLKHLFGPTLTMRGCLVLSVALGLVMYVLALALDRYDGTKRR